MGKTLTDQGQAPTGASLPHTAPDLNQSCGITLYEKMGLRPPIGDRTRIYSDTQVQLENTMNEFDAFFPAVHRLGEEQLGVKNVEGHDQYKVIPINGDEALMKDYYAHETAHLFGFDEPEKKAPDDTMTRRAAARVAQEQKAEEYLKAYASADNMSGEDLPKGTLDVLDLFGMIEVTATDGLDLELLHHLSEERPEIAKLVEQGTPVQAHYLHALGTIDVDQEEIVEGFEYLRGAATLKDTQSAVIALMDKLTPRHGQRLREAVTRAFNDLVRIGLGTNYLVDDFLEDAGDLLVLVEKNHGPRYSQIVLDQIPKLIGERCAVLIVIDDDDGEIAGYRHCLMGIYTTIPIRAKNLNLAIGTKKPFGFVSESRFPELYKAMKKMLDAESILDKPAGFFDIRIETMDGMVMRVHRSLLGNKLLLSNV